MGQFSMEISRYAGSALSGNQQLNGAEFVTLVAGSWVGTTITQSASLEAVIRSVLETGRTVTFAVKRDPPPDPEFASEYVPDLDNGEVITPEQVHIRLTI